MVSKLNRLLYQCSATSSHKKFEKLACVLCAMPSCVGTDRNTRGSYTSIWKFCYWSTQLPWHRGVVYFNWFKYSAVTSQWTPKWVSMWPFEQKCLYWFPTRITFYVLWFLFLLFFELDSYCLSVGLYTWIYLNKVLVSYHRVLVVKWIKCNVYSTVWASVFSLICCIKFKNKLK